jgi:uncharacterized cupin superfamily protein
MGKLPPQMPPFDDGQGGEKSPVVVNHIHVHANAHSHSHAQATAVAANGLGYGCLAWLIAAVGVIVLPLGTCLICSGMIANSPSPDRPKVKSVIAKPVASPKHVAASPEPEPVKAQPIIEVPLVTPTTSSEPDVPPVVETPQRSPEFRTWTSKDGTSVEAEFVSYISGKVTVRREDGKKVTIDASSLTGDSKQFLNKRGARLE